MDKTSAGGSKLTTKSPSSAKVKADSRQARETSDPANIQGAWIREDGAVCFGHECVVIKTELDGSLGLEIHPDECGESAGKIILEHLIKTAGKGVHISIPASEVKQDV
jgi:hypothetical protein